MNYEYSSKPSNVTRQVQPFRTLRPLDSGQWTLVVKKVRVEIRMKEWSMVLYARTVWYEYHSRYYSVLDSTRTNNLRPVESGNRNGNEK